MDQCEHRVGTYSYRIREDIDATLENLCHSKKMHLVDIDFIPLDILRHIWRQAIGALDPIHSRNDAHEKLDSSKINIKIRPNSSESEKWFLKVEVEESPIKKDANRADYIRELVSLGENVLKFCMIDEQDTIYCEELNDLLWRIRKAGRKPANLKVVRVHDGVKRGDIIEKLADFLIDAYIKCPTSILEHPLFWDAEKCLAFIAAVHDWLEGSPNNVNWRHNSPALRTFKWRLMALNVSNWKDNLNDTIREKGCKHPNRDNTIENSTIGMIRCIRHVYTHYKTASAKERETIYGGEFNPCDYFRKIEPAIYIHVYTCIQLSFEEFTAEFKSEGRNHFHNVFGPYVKSGPQL